MKAIEISSMTPLIQVFNMPRALEFYRGILGFEVIADSGDGDDSSWVRLRINGCDLMLNDQYEPGRLPDAPPAERFIWHGDTCLYFSCEDVDGTFEFLRSRGIELDPPKTAPYGMKQLYLSDPDSYKICFQWRAETNNG